MEICTSAVFLEDGQVHVQAIVIKISLGGLASWGVGQRLGMKELKAGKRNVSHVLSNGVQICIFASSLLIALQRTMEIWDDL